MPGTIVLSSCVCTGVILLIVRQILLASHFTFYTASHGYSIYDASSSTRTRTAIALVPEHTEGAYPGFDMAASDMENESPRQTALPATFQADVIFDKDNAKHLYVDLDIQATYTRSITPEPSATLTTQPAQQAPFELDSLNPAELTDMPFPKKIWQIWKDYTTDASERTTGFPQKWQEMHSDHRYERLTHDNALSYVRENFPSEIGDLFAQVLDPILRVDLLRYLALYNDGGIFADMDVYPTQPFSQWIPEEYLNKTNLVVGIENDHGQTTVRPFVDWHVQFAQYTMATKPGHPWVARLVQRVCENLRGLVDAKLASRKMESTTDDSDHESDDRGSDSAADEGVYLNLSAEDIFNTTGPFVYTTTLFEYLEETAGSRDRLTGLTEPTLIGDVLVLPLNAFGWLQHQHAGAPEADPSVKVVHLFVGSWRNEYSGW